MTDINEVMERAILAYIKNNPEKQRSYFNIISYFKGMRIDITLTALDNLIEQGLIIHHVGRLAGWNGNSRYEMANKTESEAK